MKIRELPILTRIDPKTQKIHAAAKNCCGWEKPAICILLYLHHPEKCAYVDGSAVNITDLFQQQKSVHMLTVELSIVELYGRNPRLIIRVGESTYMQNEWDDHIYLSWELEKMEELT